MRTNIVIDDGLMEEAFRCTEARTKKELVHLALETLIETRKRRSLLDLKGKISFDGNYDYKTARER
jgi:Arc/MetJ family transcription regulator